jgi:hypothetical protein
LREKRRLRVFEKRVLRGTFGPKRDEVTGKREKRRLRLFEKRVLRRTFGPKRNEVTRK